MAPSAPIVAALFRLSSANLDEQSMLQMPVVEKNVATDASDCACPGYYEEQCTANAFQGCIWSSDNLGHHSKGWTDEGHSDAPWCQCDPNFQGTPPLFDAPPAPAPVDPNAQAPAATCPAGWEQRGEIGADIGGCGLQGCGERYDITSEAACAARCDGHGSCVGFSYAPMNGDRNHPGVTACTIYNSDTPTGTWTGTEGLPTQVFCRPTPVVPFAGGWIDPTGSFYGGAVIRLGSVCAAENPSQEVWQTASYECVMTDGQWDFIETRADGATHSHRMVLQDDGFLRVIKGEIEWTLRPDTSGCAAEIDGGGWELVRHVPMGNEWHAATDQLRGHDVYGNSAGGALSAQGWSVPFPVFDQFLFATGDCAKWLIADKDEVTGAWYSNENRQILKSSASEQPHQARWYRREPNLEDPWVSITDHASAIGDGDIVYGEHGVVSSPHASNILPAHNGANVYVRCTACTPAPAQMINNWNFEQMTVNGAAGELEEGRWIHFLNAGNSGLSNTAIPGWHQMGSGSGASGLYNTPNNEIAAEGSHVLFLNSGDDSNYVYQDLLWPFTATINIEAAVGGGNGGNDGGYRFGLYSEDGTLVQETAAGVNGAPDTEDTQYILTQMSVSVADHPEFEGQTLQLRLMKNKGQQGHYHYISIVN